MAAGIDFGFLTWCNYALDYICVKKVLNIIILDDFN